MSDTIETHICTHPIGKCKIVATVDVTPNSFNIVLDKDDPLLSHVLQCDEVDIHGLYTNQNDITKHKMNGEG